MNDKVYAIVTKKEKDVLGLKYLLLQLSRELKFEVVGEGAYWSKYRKVHSEAFNFQINGKKIGSYEFRLKDMVYHGILDLGNFPEPIYERVMEITNLQFQKLFPQYSRA